jgi:uncharacterized protein
VSRDRDAAGRPRNARPRDATGRPLPRDASGPPPVDDAPALNPADALVVGESLLRDGHPFAAHEVFEAVWKATSDQERGVFRGLAQLAVAMTHRQRRNVKGARALFARAAATLDPWDAVEPYGVAVRSVRTWCAAAADDPDAAGDPPTLTAR